MSRDRTQAGFSLVEVLVSLAILTVGMTLLASLLIENSKVNRAQQARMQVQSSARTTLALVAQKLRQAGWNPGGGSVSTVTLDSDLTDSINYIDLFADYNADGDADDTGESIRIRHVGDRIEWRETSSAPYEIIAVNITNDADGDGVPEPMFTPDASPDPTRISVTVTAASRVIDPYTDEPVRYTLTSDVFLRNAD